MGLRLGLKSSWNQPAGAGQGELGDTIRAYTSDDDTRRVQGGTAARDLVLTIIVALAIAGAVALLWPASTPEPTTGSAAPAASARGDKACADQTWPYLSSECLSRKR